MFPLLKVLTLCLLFFYIFGASLSQAAAVSELTQKVVNEFYHIAKFPRPSGHEKAVSDHLVSWAKARNFTVQQDAANNVIIDKPATKGHENKPLVVLQSHLDMICVSTNKNYDSKKDAIIVISDGETLKAKDTSLGADGAIGLAIALVVLDSNIPSGPLRLIATTEEEVGLRGAKNLDVRYLENVDYIINLDSEKSHEATMGCAGSVRTTVVRQAKTTAPNLKQAISISAFDYLGGHSGNAIKDNRGNPIKTLTYILSIYKKNGVKFELASLEGGTALNAIPSSCTALVVVDEKEKAMELAYDFHKSLAKAHKMTDPNIKLEIKSIENPKSVLAQEDSQYFLNYIMITHSGLIAMDQTMKDIASISTNIGLAKAKGNEITVGTMGRSLFSSYVDQLRLTAEHTAKATGFEITNTSGYYPWEVNKNSRLAKLIADIYKKQNGAEIILTATSGGLECAAFLDKNPNIDAISIGPDVFNGHSPDEYVVIKSIDKTLNLLIETLSSIS